MFKELLPMDEWTDREGCGEHYQIWGCTRRGPVFLPRDSQNTDTLQLNPVTKAVFGVAKVTFEVRVRYWRIRQEITLDHLALEGTKRVRPNTIRPSGPIEAHSAFRGQNSRGQNSLRRVGSLGGDHPANV